MIIRSIHSHDQLHLGDLGRSKLADRFFDRCIGLRSFGFKSGTIQSVIPECFGKIFGSVLGDIRLVKSFVFSAFFLVHSLELAAGIIVAGHKAKEMSHLVIDRIIIGTKSHFLVPCIEITGIAHAGIDHDGKSHLRPCVPDLRVHLGSGLLNGRRSNRIAGLCSSFHRGSSLNSRGDFCGDRFVFGSLRIFLGNLCQNGSIAEEFSREVNNFWADKFKWLFTGCDPDKIPDWVWSYYDIVKAGSYMAGLRQEGVFPASSNQVLVFNSYPSAFVAVDMLDKFDKIDFKGEKRWSDVRTEI